MPAISAMKVRFKVAPQEDEVTSHYLIKQADAHL
jgi:hypothetical protein